MPDPRKDGLYFLTLGILTFVLLGLVFERFSSLGMLDFKAHYYAARCLLERLDPYQQANVSRVYRAEGGIEPGDSAGMETIITRYIYFPTAFTFTLPAALMKFGLAQWFWILVTAATLSVAAYLTWRSAAEFAPTLSGAMIAFLLADGLQILVSGNVAGIVVGLCVIGAWCFLSDRFVAIGAVFLAISLALKPHDSVLVWLYFLLAGGSYRKRAVISLTWMIALSVPSLLILTLIAPRWPLELGANLEANSARGGLSDPGPASGGVRASMIHLQIAVSELRDDPAVYNPVVYCVVGIPLLVWSLTTLRSQASGESASYALASVAALSMLPVYHRRDDALLLLLSVPACARLWAKGGQIGRLALASTATGFFAVGDVVWPVLFNMTTRSHLMQRQSLQRFLNIGEVFLSPCVLLVIGVFYLWIYMKSARGNLSQEVGKE